MIESLVKQQFKGRNGFFKKNEDESVSIICHVSDTYCKGLPPLFV
jgi:hypothetical protein